MIKAYDRDKNRLNITLGEVTYDLVLRPHITQICGEAATGKTMLARGLKLEQEKTEKGEKLEYDTFNIKVYDNGVCISDLEEYRDCLIVIDRADLFLDKEVGEYIASDTKNQYLIMGRTALPLHISPNYYGQFAKVDGAIRIRYDYSVRGWF